VAVNSYVTPDPLPAVDVSYLDLNCQPTTAGRASVRSASSIVLSGVWKYKHMGSATFPFSYVDPNPCTIGHVCISPVCPWATRLSRESRNLSVQFLLSSNTLALDRSCYVSNSICVVS